VTVISMLVFFGFFLQETPEKATENVVSSTEPCPDAPDEGKKMGECLKAVVDKYRDKLNMRYVDDISTAKRKQWVCLLYFPTCFIR